MDKTILVAYASKYGATAEIAGKIGQVLREQGFGTDVHAVTSIRDLAPYRAVILGSAVYIGKWRKEALAFLKANETALADKSVWLFSSGPTGKGRAEELLKGWQLPRAVQDIAVRIRARGTAVFHGDLNSGKLNPVDRWMIQRVKAPAGDFRDWEAIASWAVSIATDLERS